MAQVNVTINGRTYRMACDDGQEEHLLGLAKGFSDTIERLRAEFGEIGDMRLTVMAGIMAADEAHELRRRVSRLEAELAELKQSRQVLLEQFRATEETMKCTIDHAAGRLEGIARSLNGADTPEG
jgi:cell division protein ZapA